ncbi:MAG TPA: hypothetical protein VN653_08255 [Anaerolineales bacterium]|nr:hypothetical protein [Anaerolineales bacterium]
MLQPIIFSRTRTGLSLDGDISQSELSKHKIYASLLHNLKVVANEAKAQTNHMTNTPRLHPSVGECLSPLVGGDAEL